MHPLDALYSDCMYIVVTMVANCVHYLHHLVLNVGMQVYEM